MEEELVELLTHRVRVFTPPQIASAFCCAASEAESLITQLEGDGVLERQSVLTRPLLPLSGPVVRWIPGGEAPDFGKVAYQLKARWTEPVEPTEIVMASKAAARKFGGYLGGRWPRVSEITHDINLTQVFLWHREHRPEDAQAWIPEAQLYAEGRGHKERLPDAVIRPRGVDLRIVEFGGSYGKQKLAGFHVQMSDLPYEIW